MKLFFSEKAEQFLFDLFEYIAIEKLAPDSAEKVITEIKQGVNKLKNFPKIWSILKGDNIRFLVIGNYIAVYEISENRVVITHIYGKGQNWR